MRRLVFGLLLVAAPCFAAPAPVPEIAGPIIAPVATHHRETIGGQAIDYIATFAETALNDGNGRALATISATSYVRQPEDPHRPVLFVFNGGPGASSSPLHFGAFGPRRIVTGSDGKRSLADNPYSLLVDADLVFIDPVGTGFSRVLPGGDGQPYWSVDGDAKAVLDLIRAWLGEHSRSSVFIAGESYGGFRLARLAKDAADLPISGLILISPLLDASASTEAPGNDMPFIFGLPSMAVTAWKQGRTHIDAAEPGRVFDLASHFAESDYALALLQGSRLAPAEKTRIAARMAELIGLPVKLIEDHDLRIGTDLFVESLLADQDKTVGRLDGRVSAPVHRDLPSDRPAAANDPSLGLGKSNVITNSVAADYFRDELGVSPGRDYVSLTLDVNFRFDFHTGGRDGVFYTNPTPNIGALMKAMPNSRLLLVGGYYDLAVPLLAPRYAIDRAGIPLDRVAVAAFESGHSAFDGDAALTRMQALMHGFLLER
jgi:carboxypeptidase C (cathepsin A)